MGEELGRAEGIAREAGRVLLRHYHGDLAVDDKGGEPVTAADRESNALIVERLREAFPDDAVVAEESSLDPELEDGVRTWVVDPLDGTKEFIAHNGEFCLMIGLVVEGRPAAGVVYRPTDDLLYRGGPGIGAERVRGDDVLELRVSEVSDPAAMRLVMSRSHRDERFGRMMAELGIEEPWISGSVGLKAGLVAEGICDLYLHPSRGTKLWDTAAPEAILAGAGGRITDFDGGPLRYDPRHVENLRGILVSNGTSHDELVERLRPFFPRQ